MADGFGGALAAPIWTDFMTQARDGFCGDWAPPSTPWRGTAFTGPHSASKNSIPQNTPTYTTPAQIPGPYTNPQYFSAPPQTPPPAVVPTTKPPPKHNGGPPIGVSPPPPKHGNGGGNGRGNGGGGGGNGGGGGPPAH
jgi:uncharacterized membrane protein YgcG